MKEYEILSPAGSVEQLCAAVNNGCDSVYLGMADFNARMKAPNFDAENLRHWVDYCHFFGVKVYVAVNTSIKNSEFSHAVKTLLTAYRNFADGVIITDLALLKIAASLPKPFDVVASTQLNTHDGYGARFLKNLGATTVVCARECSYSEIEDIIRTDVAVECFLHGALCVCQSGQCLFSSMVGGNSGNRGLCAQPCRKFYKANAGKFKNGGYLLSASDICGLQSAEKLNKLGVYTFKIEGRNRKPEYAGATAKVYSQFFEHNFDMKYADKKTLAEVFNRGDLPVCGYLSEQNGKIIYPFAQNHIGVPVGKIQNGKIVAYENLKKGDGLKLMDKNREVCGGTCLTSGTEVAATFTEQADGMTVRRTSSVELSEKILAERRKREVSVELSAFSDKKAILILKSEGVEVSVESDFFVPKAEKKATTIAELTKQLQKIGDLQYTISNIVVYCDDIFLAKSQINGLRRSAFEKLNSKILATYNSKFGERENVILNEESYVGSSNADKTNRLMVICRNADQINLCGDAVVIFKPEIISDETVSCSSRFCYIDLPSFSDNNYIFEILKKEKSGIVCHNIGQVQMAREHKIRYIAGTGLNIFNDEMAEIFFDADYFLYSQELTFAEIEHFKNQSGFVFVDGEIVLMKLMHCPFKTALNSTCERCLVSQDLVYTDELNNNFVIKRRKDRRCSFELINGKKLSVASKLNCGGRYCIDFDPSILSHYKNLNSGYNDGYAEHRPFTKGRLFDKIK